MQLSVSTSPADPSLASFLPGGDLPCPANSGGNASSFGTQFPLLAPTSGAIPADATVASAPGELAPTWIGSTIPQAPAQPRLPALPGNPAAPVAKLIGETSADTLPASAATLVVVATPTRPSTATTEPTGPRPTSRAARCDEPTSLGGVNPLSAEMAQALAVAPVSMLSAPVALPLAETAPAPSPVTVTVDAMANGSLPASSSRGTVVPASSLAPLTDGTLPTPLGDTAEPIREEIAPRSGPSRAMATSPATSRPAVGELAASSRALATPSFDATAFAPHLHPVPGPEGAVTSGSTSAAETLSAVRNFAPAEIHSRQFAFASLSSPIADFASAAVADASVATPAFPPSFPVATSLPPSASPAPVADATVEMASAIASGAVESTVAAPREFAPHARTEKASALRGAKIAAPGEIVSTGENREENGSDKTFVNVSSERVARGGAPLGTDVAKSEPTMSAPFNHSASSAAVLEHAPVAWAATEPADRSAEFSATSVLAPETTEAAHRAVEAVLTAVERSSTGERHAVNLNFSVGGNDLNVRVELRADEVRATFLTDSPELRTALAHEWQAARSATDSADRPLRLVTPVFASHADSSSSNSSGLTSFSGGDGSSRQRESGARRSASDLAAVSGVRSAGARSASLGAAADSTSASAVARSAPPTSHRLHTHA